MQTTVAHLDNKRQFNTCSAALGRGWGLVFNVTPWGQPLHLLFPSQDMLSAWLVIAAELLIIVLTP